MTRARSSRRCSAFGCLTAQRGGEVHGAAWAEFDLASGWWTIPAERSKNGLAHRVPLSPQAVRILKAWRRVAW